MRISSVALIALLSSAGGCAGNMDDTSTPAAKTSIAAQVVAANAATDVEAHLIARQYSADGNEVLEFYEPIPGQLMISGAGRPAGESVFAPRRFAGMTIGEVWRAVAPGVAMPDALAPFAADKRMASASLPPVSETGSVVRPLGTTTYCRGQFYADYASYTESYIDTQAEAPVHLVQSDIEYIDGDHGTGYTTSNQNVGKVNGAVCDDTDGTGGTFYFGGNIIGGHSWAVTAGGPARWAEWNTTQNCGYNAGCQFTLDSWYSCSPGPSQNAYAHYVPGLGALSGSGDHYGFIAGYFTYCNGCEGGCQD